MAYSLFWLPDWEAVLLDSGESGSVVHNASELGIALCTIDKIVLSHGHCDHTGGLRELLMVMRKRVEIITHPDMWDAKYVKRPGEVEYRYIGIPFQREELESMGASHCTGFGAAVRLAGEFGDIFFVNNTGTRLEV